MVDTFAKTQDGLPEYDVFSLLLLGGGRCAQDDCRLEEIPARALSAAQLYSRHTPVPLSPDDFRTFVQKRVVSTAEACELLDCSRQNIDDLVRRKKIRPVRADAKNRLFLRNELLQRRKA